LKAQGRHGRSWTALIAIGALVLATLLLAAPALAAPLTFTVDSNGDEADQTINGTCATAGNVCTLRAAIQEANANPGADTIDFAPSVTGTIGLTSVLPQIADDLTIDGPGAGVLAIDGNNTFRVIDAQSGTTTAISGLTIRQGQAPVVSGGTFAGAGGIVSGGDMTLDRVVVSDNHAVVTSPGTANVEALGAGIEVAGGTLTLTRSTVRNNDARATTGGAGDAVSLGGGIYLTGGTLHVNRSAVLDNQANATINAGAGASKAWPGGGGIYMYQSTLTIDESTINGNSVTATGATDPGVANYSVGGGIYQDNLSSLSVTGSTFTDNGLGTPGGPHDFTQGANLDLLSGGTFRDTIVAEPVGAPNCIGTFDSNNYNLEDDPEHTCGFTHATDIAGQDPKLAPPANNGGPTLTRKPMKGSPVIDKGRSFGAPTDQRGTGFPRIIDSPFIANATGGDGSDIGAFERDSIPPAKPMITSTNPASPANNNDPRVRGSAEAGSLVRIYKTANCTGKPAAKGSATALQSPGIAVHVADNTTTVFHATATDSSNNTSACSAGRTYVEDSTPPNTTIDSLKVGHVYNTATVTFHSSQAGSTFRCRIDANPYAPCTSPKKYAGLAQGSHTIRVIARDRAGNADPTPARQTFTM